MKIAIAQITTNPGEINKNTEKIVQYIQKSRQKNVKMIVFPELAIPGYLSLDLILNDKYIKQNLKALNNLIEHTENITVIVGFIDLDNKKLRPDNLKERYNSAAIIHNKKLIAIQDKTLLPNYDIFYENRYFASARDRKIIPLNGFKLGIQICEDLWNENYPINVSEDLIEKGANLLINISASPFYVGKKFDRENLIKKTVKNYKVPFIYANLVGVQDGYDGEIIFDGQSMVFNKKGVLIALGKQFKEELIFVDFDANAKEPVYTKFNEAEEMYNAIVFGIKKYFEKNNFKKCFIGLSGGIDSAVVAALAVEALGKKNVIAIGMPSRYSSKGSKDDAENLAENLGIEFRSITIEKAFNSFENIFEKEFNNLQKDVTEENIQARIRGLILMAFSNKFKGLVISTGNKTEMALGYCTLYGDMCGGLAAISDVNKIRVYELADYINKKAEEEIIPKNTIKKAPSAELSENQTDEKGLGAEYNILSPLIDEIIENQTPFEKLIEKYPKKIVNKIIGMINKNEYKRRQAPPGIKITKKSFGIGRRIPISHKFEG